MKRDYRALQQNRAIYTIAGQSDYHSFVRKDAAQVRGGALPLFMRTPADLDYLDQGNPFFHVDRALFSAGPVLRGEVPGHGMFSPRAGATIIGDSGGFQLIDRPELFSGDKTRATILRWLESNCDEAMTLDIPSDAVAPNSPFDTFDVALAVTVENLSYFATNRTPAKVRFLNVQQGRSSKEAVRWYEATKNYSFEGWAFGGAMRLNIQHLVKMLCRMHRDGVLDKTRNRVHVLGAGTLQLAVMLSAIQRGVRELTKDDDFLITFDTSSPSQLMVRGQAYGYPIFTPAEFRLPTFKAPSSYAFAHHKSRFPFKNSSIGSLMSVSDLNAVGSTVRQSGWDSLGNQMIVNHNLDALQSAIDDANSLMELPAEAALEIAPNYLVRSYHAVLASFTQSDPLSHLRAYTADLARCSL